MTYRFRIIDNLESNEKNYELVLKKLKSISNSINQLLKIPEFNDKKALMYIKNRIQKLIDKYKTLEELDSQYYLLFEMKEESEIITQGDHC